MAPEQIKYKILHKVVNHHEKRPTAKLIYIETQGEHKLSELTYRLFLETMQSDGLIKIWGPNKSDWGQIIVTPTGEQFVSEFKDMPYAERDYENFSQYVEMLVKKNTRDLIIAKRSAELHLQKQLEMLERQRDLANRGKMNFLGHQIKQADFARFELHKINEEVEVRTAMGEKIVDDTNINTTIKTKAQTIEEERIEMFNKCIDKNGVYCPTTDKFKQQVAIEKLNPDMHSYLKFLWNEQVKYTEAKRYYDTWGARGTGTDRGHLYGEILNLINFEIELGLKGYKNADEYYNTVFNIGNKTENKSNTLSNIFTGQNWHEFMEPLTLCTPKLLAKEGETYCFVGNKKTQRGIIAQYFKYLKAKGIINQSINRDELADILSKSIKDFSINGSSIDNTSTLYRKTFAKQLETISIS